MLYGDNEPRSARNLPPSRPTVFPEHEGRTRQEDMRGTDLNVMMAQYERTGSLPMSHREAFFADVSEMTDFREAIEVIHRAEAGFMQLPAALRTRFGNDPVRFLEFTNDEANRDELVSLGLIDSPDDVVSTPESAATAEPEAAATE